MPSSIDAQFADLASQFAPTNTAAPPVAASSAPDIDSQFAALKAQSAQQQAPNQPTPWFPSSFGSLAKEVGNNIVRAGAKAIWALPGMAEDAGVAVRDLIAGKNANGQYPYTLPSTTFNQALDKVTNAPTNIPGKVGEFASSTMLGSLLGGPSYKTVPDGFVSPKPPLPQYQQSLNEARQAGYVFPPSTVKPTILNKTIEAIGGKTATAQDAAIANMPTTTNAARLALIQSGAKIGPNEELTPELLKQIRTTAAGAQRDVVTKSGNAVNLDAPYSQAIATITAPYKQAAAELGPEFGNPSLVNSATAIDKPQMTPSVAMKAIQQLRDKADMAFRAGDNTTGVAYKGLATNLENGIDRHLAATGNQGTVDAYRAARALQAKTFDIEKALNDTTGQVNAGILKRAPYLSGPLATAAKAASIAPKATREILDSGSVRNTDVITGGLASVMEHDPKFLLYPFARQAVRAAMLSKVGQNALIGKVPQVGPQLLPHPPQGLMSGAIPSLFGQWNLANH